MTSPPPIHHPAVTVREAKARAASTPPQAFMADASLVIEADGYVTHADGTVDGDLGADAAGGAR